MKRDEKEKYVYEIILNLVKLEKYGWNEFTNIDDFKDIWSDLVKLSDEELEELYWKIMGIFLETYKKMTNTLWNIKKQLNKELEKSEKEDEENILNNFNF
jgi:hypothetical protein